MATITDTELDAFLKKRDEQIYSRLLLNRVFQARVQSVLGAPPDYKVMVTRTGETASDGMTYPTVSNWDPVVGDTVDIIWRDDNVGYAAFPVSTGALGRMPARHPYYCRIYWVGSYGMPANAWTYIPYNNVTVDPSSMLTSGDIVVPVSGSYLVAMSSGTSSGSSGIDITTGIWITPKGGVGAQVSQGSRATLPASLGNSSVVVDVLRLGAGDAISGYVWTNTSGAVLLSGSLSNYLTVCLQTR